MGMAASQARLLTITARLADNELKSQSINNAKMRLATQSSQASEKYINALNSANLMFSNYDASGTAQSQLLTFNALTAFSSYNNQYGLVNAAGQLLVSESEAKIYESAGGNLNDYLQAHGLVYDTTYFDKLEAIDNKGMYPEPFNNISTADLKSWYEAYGSIENSQEQEDYEKKYNDYVASSNALKTALKTAFSDYVEKNTKSDYNGTSLTEDNPKSISGLYNRFDSFANNINYLTSSATENIAEIKKRLKYDSDKGLLKVSGVPTSVSISDELDADKKPTGNFVLAIDDDKWTYTQDALGKYKIISCPEKEVDSEDANKIYTQYDMPTVNLFDSIEAMIKALSYTSNDYNEDGSLASTDVFKFEDVTKDAKGNYTVTSYYTIPNGTASDANANYGRIKTTLEDYLSSIYSVLTSQESINIDELTEKQLNGELNETNFVNIEDTKYNKDGKSINDLMTDYNAKRKDFINFIFSDGENASANNTSAYAEISKLLKLGVITAKELTNADYVLKLLSGYAVDNEGNSIIDSSNGNIKLSSAFGSVIKNMFVKNMISETGEPKYSWIDENDTTNSGNAEAKAQWYTNLFNRMKEGYKQLENGLASSSQWIEYALESGIVSMEQVDKNYTWKSLDYKTCTKITEETDNSAAVTKAEAEYNRAMNDINSKDSMYDIQLKNIDTEHSALQTEYDSIKNAMTKNIERTFKFSSNG